MSLHARSMFVLLTISGAAYALPNESADASASTESVAEPRSEIQRPHTDDDRARRAARFHTARRPAPPGAGMGGGVWAGGANDVTWGLTDRVVTAIKTRDGTTVVDYGRLANMYCIVVVYPVCAVLTHDLVRGMVEAWSEEAKRRH
jgi:hypothetical protein